MDYVAKFIAYASAFERAFESDEWEPVAACFAEHAHYCVPFGPPLGGRFEGPAAIVGYLRDILDRLDRRFATRTPELLELNQSGPEGCIVEIRGRVRYTHPAVPDLEFELREIAHFEGNAIVRLEDLYDDTNRQRILDYITAHGEQLGMDLGALGEALGERQSA